MRKGHLAGDTMMKSPTRSSRYINALPKAELHCHIEGAAKPDLVLAQAKLYDVDASPFVNLTHGYLWKDFTSFLAAYDFAASLFRKPEDYIRLSEAHFTSLASQNCIYGEIFASPEHAARIGCSYITLIEAISEGISLAKSATGIEGRIIVTGVRHVGAEAVEEAARLTVKNPHPMVTGFGMAGDERMGRITDFVRAFDIARDGGLELTAHAGEFGGADSVCEALDHLKISRIGHGVRAVEDTDLVKRLAQEQVVLEICPASNIMLNVFPSFDQHSFPALEKAGCVVTLNSDDPPHFHTTLTREYEIAAEHFCYDRENLLRFTKNAINAAFVDGDTRNRLLEKLAMEAVG